MKRKMMRVILTGVCAVCLTACGKSEKDAASEYYQEQFGMSEEDADELANALYGNGGAQTETKPETEAAPEAEAEPETEAEQSLEYVEPAAEDFEYKYDAVLGGVVITQYNGEAEAIRIPAEIDGELVVKVRLVEPSYTTNHSGITHVELPDGITDIDNYAFHRCVSLTEITIPGSVTSIGDYAFYLCSNLENIIIPDGVTSIGEEAFYSCDSLTEVTIPGSVTSTGARAFSSCDSLTEVTILDGVTSIDLQAFSGCKSLAEVTIPDSVTRIEQEAFLDCSSLTEVTIPDSVTRIGLNAFAGCSSLRNLTIPDDTEIVARAFYGCDGLTVTYQGQEYNYANDPNGWWQ